MLTSFAILSIGSIHCVMLRGSDQQKSPCRHLNLSLSGLSLTLSTDLHLLLLNSWMLKKKKRCGNNPQKLNWNLARSCLSTVLQCIVIAPSYCFYISRQKSPNFLLFPNVFVYNMVFFNERPSYGDFHLRSYIEQHEMVFIGRIFQFLSSTLFLKGTTIEGSGKISRDLGKPLPVTAEQDRVTFSFTRKQLCFHTGQNCMLHAIQRVPSSVFIL